MPLTKDLDYLIRSLNCVTCNGGQHTHIEIVEHDPSAKLKKVKIIADNGEWFCFSPDEGRKCKRLCKGRGPKLTIMSPLLSIGSEFYHHCACDAVIFIKDDKKLSVLYIDLKSNNPTGYSNQFKSTRQFVKYLVSLNNEFNKNNITITEERYIIFHTNKLLINKKTTIPKPKIKPSSPDDPYKRIIDNSSIYLKELLS